MSDLIIGYYLLSGVLFLSFIGLLSVVCDMIWNKEKIIITRKSKTDLAQFASNDYEYDDDLIIN